MTKSYFHYSIYSKNGAISLQDYLALVELIKEFPNLELSEQSSNQFHLRGGGGELAILELGQFSESSREDFPCAFLTLTKSEPVTLQLFQVAAERHPAKLRLYSEALSSYLPRASELLFMPLSILSPELRNVFDSFSLEPLFCAPHRRVWYARNQSAEVVIINSSLLDFAVKHGTEGVSQTELSYAVAEDISSFTALYDAGLIPNDFFRCYGRSLKLLNDSYFNIEVPSAGKKIFVKPLIYQLEAERSEYFTISGTDGGALLRMDKIRRGETLDDTLKRVLSEELKIANDYLRAHILNTIEYDLDRDGQVTPRLIVRVYVAKVNNEQYVKRLARTGWKSTDGRLPKKLPHE